VRRLAALAALAASLPLFAADLPPAPVAAKQAHETKIHGDTLADDYFWLRNKGTPEVESYLNAERAYSEAFMQPTAALQSKLYDEMLSRIQQTDINVPARDRGFYYYSRTVEGKQYPIYARKKGSLDASEEVILDVNALADGKKFMSIGGMEVSPDGRLLAYTSDEVGFRQYTLHVKDLRTGKLLPTRPSASIPSSGPRTARRSSIRSSTSRRSEPTGCCATPWAARTTRSSTRRRTSASPWTSTRRATTSTCWWTSRATRLPRSATCRRTRARRR
jgi:protease II